MHFNVALTISIYSQLKWWLSQKKHTYTHTSISEMDSSTAVRRSSRFSSYERLLVIIFTIVAVISPLYIDRRATIELEDEEEESLNVASLLPLLVLVVILAIFISCYLEQNRFDPYWIHRVGGSSGGIILILTILSLVLKYKS